MRTHFATFILIASIFFISCENDRRQVKQTGTSKSDLAVERDAHVDDLKVIDQLLSDGLRLDTSFSLGPGTQSVAVVYLESDGALDASVRVDGFDGPLESLAVVETVDGLQGRVLLYIHKDGIVDGNGNRLVDQIPAVHGYAWRVGSSSADAVLGRRNFISVIILDKDGAGISDELYIYWNPDRGEGSGFVVTNIPNEIL